jgi:hypothetical protein
MVNASAAVVMIPAVAAEILSACMEPPLPRERFAAADINRERSYGALLQFGSKRRADARASSDQ